jgi:hypothetical protein
MVGPIVGCVRSLLPTGGLGGRHGAVMRALPELTLAAPVSDPPLLLGWARVSRSYGGGCEVAAAEVASREVGFVQRIAVEPHLTSCSVEVLPESERQVVVVTEIDGTVEGEFELAVLQDLKRR